MLGGRGLNCCGSGQSKLLALLNMAMDFQVPQNLRNFVASRETISISSTLSWREFICVSSAGTGSRLICV